LLLFYKISPLTMSPFGVHRRITPSGPPPRVYSPPPASLFFSSFTRVRRTILPTADLGRESLHSTILGTLKGASLSLQKYLEKGLAEKIAPAARL